MFFLFIWIVLCRKMDSTFTWGWVPRGHILKSVSLHPKVRRKKKQFKEWFKKGLLGPRLPAMPLSSPLFWAGGVLLPLNSPQLVVGTVHTFQQLGSCLHLNISLTNNCWGLTVCKAPWQFLQALPYNKIVFWCAEQNEHKMYARVKWELGGLFI